MGWSGGQNPGVYFLHIPFHSFPFSKPKKLKISENFQPTVYIIFHLNLHFEDLEDSYICILSIKYLTFVF